MHRHAGGCEPQGRAAGQGESGTGGAREGRCGTAGWEDGRAAWAGTRGADRGEGGDVDDEAAVVGGVLGERHLPRAAV